MHFRHFDLDEFGDLDSEGNLFFFDFFFCSLDEKREESAIFHSRPTVDSLFLLVGKRYALVITPGLISDETLRRLLC